MHPTEEINARRDGANRDFIRMKLKDQAIAEKTRDVRQKRLKQRTVVRQKYKIICIANVVPRLKLMLRELIKLVHVDVHEKLRSEISERQTLAGAVLEKLWTTWPMSQRMSWSGM